MMSEETIQLNGQYYDPRRIEELKYECEPANSWRNAVYFFLKYWFDDSDVIITHTSGSTGEPKEIRLSKEILRNSARMTNAFFGLDASKTALLCLPVSYIAGKMMLVRAMVGRFNLICVEPKANPFENLKIPVDFTAITPYQLHHSGETLKTASVKNIIVGGSAVSSRLETLAADIPARMYETYGMTETASHIALRCFNGAEKSDYFTALAGVALRQDERGCLAITAPHLHSQNLITNDIVEMQGENQFKWLGRADAVINTGGVKIFPEQVEKKLEAIIPGNFFISSLPDEQLGEKVILLIESDTEISSLNIALKQLLSPYEQPKQVIYLPRFVYSPNNKILRKDSLVLAMK
jgi:o-succinylbenzoate---CoA ligase